MTSGRSLTIGTSSQLAINPTSASIFMELVVLPHQSVGPIKFGMSKQEVRSALSALSPGGKAVFAERSLQAYYESLDELLRQSEERFLELYPDSVEELAQESDALENSVNPEVNEWGSEDRFDSLDIYVGYAGASPYGCDGIQVYPPNRLFLDGRELFSCSIESAVNLLTIQGKRLEIGFNFVTVPGLGIMLECEDFNLFKDRPPTRVSIW
jgi:hypothetical protein